MLNLGASPAFNLPKPCMIMMAWMMRRSHRSFSCSPSYTRIYVYEIRTYVAAAPIKLWPVYNCSIKLNVKIPYYRFKMYNVYKQ